MLENTQGGTAVTDPPKSDPPAPPPVADPPKTDPPKADPPKVDPPKVDPPKADNEPPKTDSPAKPAVPAKYELKLPENSHLEATVTERTDAIARELGLSNEAAQKVLEFAHTELGTAVDKAVAAKIALHQPGGAEWAKMVEGWKGETLADPFLGSTPEEREASVAKGELVLARFTEAHPQDAQAFKDFLKTSGLANHPSAVRFLVYLGRSASEDTLVVPDGQGVGSSDEVRLRNMYPTMAAKT